MPFPVPYIRPIIFIILSGVILQIKKLKVIELKPFPKILQPQVENKPGLHVVIPTVCASC